MPYIVYLLLMMVFYSPICCCRPLIWAFTMIASLSFRTLFTFGVVVECCLLLLQSLLCRFAFPGVLRSRYSPR